MKLPFDFALKFIFRLVLPGALLTAVLWPLLLLVRQLFSLTVADAVFIPVSILLLGWVVVLCDMPIYMIAEGRRFWPSWMKAWRLKAHKERLAAIYTKRAGLAAGTSERLELTVKTLDFPLDYAGQREVRMPTRLGNLIYASETYPESKYGIDGVFAWSRLWVVIDKDLRAEMDDRQALVDSALYSSTIAFVAAPVCLAYALIQWFAPNWFPIVIAGPWVLLGFAALALICGWLLYLTTLYAQRPYGEMFCSIFDQYIDKLEFSKVVTALSAHMNDAGLSNANGREKARAAIRFLKFHKYRPIGGTANQDITDW